MKHIQAFQHFVFGYGSLICGKSRSITVPDQADKVATPVVVNGVERVWTKRTTRGMTAMGVRMREKAECVGVLLPVNDEELKEFDKREQGYDRVQLELDDVEAVPFLGDEHYEDEDHNVFLDAKKSNATDKVKLWVYVPRKHTTPTPEHPIVQTYVDTILRGCLAISEEFAKEFIVTTKGWSPEELSDDSDHQDSNSDADDSMEQDEDEDEDENSSADDTVIWVDDRHKPVYIRGDPEHSRNKAHELDRLLHKYSPSHFSNRKRLHKHPQE